MNPRLRTIVADAKSINMPNENIAAGNPAWHG